MGPGPQLAKRGEIQSHPKMPTPVAAYDSVFGRGSPERGTVTAWRRNLFTFIYLISLPASDGAVYSCAEFEND